MPSKKNCAPAAPAFLDTNSKAFLLTLPLSRTTKLLEVKNFEIGSLSIQYCISKINSIRICLAELKLRHDFEDNQREEREEEKTSGNSSSLDWKCNETVSLKGF